MTDEQKTWRTVPLKELIEVARESPNMQALLGWKLLNFALKCGYETCDDVLAALIEEMPKDE